MIIEWTGYRRRTRRILDDGFAVAIVGVITVSVQTFATADVVVRCRADEIVQTWPDQAVILVPGDARTEPA